MTRVRPPGLRQTRWCTMRAAATLAEEPALDRPRVQARALLDEEVGVEGVEGEPDRSSGTPAKRIFFIETKRAEIGGKCLQDRKIAVGGQSKQNETKRGKRNKRGSDGLGLARTEAAGDEALMGSGASSQRNIRSAKPWHCGLRFGRRGLRPRLGN